MTMVDAPVASRAAPAPAIARGAQGATVRGSTFGRRLGRALWSMVRGSSGSVAMAVVVVALWWLAVEVTNTSIIVAPSPADVWHDFTGTPGVYLHAAASTLQTAMLALVIGVALGTLLAIAKWWSPVLAGLTELPTLFFRSLPFVALVPVASRVLGYGPRTTLLISAIIAFFPSFALVDSGLRHVPPGSDDLLSVLGASQAQRLRRIAFPASIPQAATAIRLSATLCILGTMSSEFLTGSGGLGGLYAASRITYLHPARTWTIAVVTAVMSFVAFGLASALERRAQARHVAI